MRDLLILEALDGCSSGGTVFWRMLDGTCCFHLSHNRRDVRSTYLVSNRHEAVLCGGHTIFADGWNDFFIREDETGADRSVDFVMAVLIFFSNRKETLPM